MSTAPYELYPEESVCVQVKTVQEFILVFKPRPVRAFLITRTVGGGGVGPPGDRPLLVAELHGKHSMRLDEISRLHILFLDLGQHLT